MLSTDDEIAPEQQSYFCAIGMTEIQNPKMTASAD